MAEKKKKTQNEKMKFGPEENCGCETNGFRVDLWL